jgi:iron complex transport system substrate-binding protein
MVRCRLSIGLILGYCCLSLTVSARADISVVDDRGRQVTIEAPAQRVISLAPHLTEILFAIDAGPQIVGTVMYADYPEAAKEIPRLGDAFSVSVESVVNLAPDIVFAWHTGGTSRSVQRLIDLGVPVYINESPTLASLTDGFDRIGRLVGRQDKAQQVSQHFRDRLGKLRSVEAKAKVFFQISDQSLYTVTGDHLIGQAISLCGGRNIFQNITPSVPLVSQEAVLAARPDIVFITQAPGSPQSVWVKTWAKYPELIGSVQAIDPNLISRPAPRMLEGIETLCGMMDSVSTTSNAVAQ